MKNLLCLLLILLLMLNVLGYYGIFMGLQYKNNQEMISRLDADNYKESETVTIKIPIAVPYAADSKDFERVDGQFEYNGEFYRLVKQKLSQDTLTVICVKDHTHKRIHQALSGFVRTFTDNPAGHHSNSKLVVTFSKDYIADAFCLYSFSSGWALEVTGANSISDFIPTFYSSIIHPPERG